MNTLASRLKTLLNATANLPAGMCDRAVSPRHPASGRTATAAELPRPQSMARRPAAQPPAAGTPALRLAHVRHAALAALPALLLAACADMSGIAPQAGLKTPEAIVQASLPDLPANGWWSAFGDAQLDALVRQALDGNPGLQATHARVEQARAAAGMAEALTLPAVGADASFHRERFTENQFIPPPFGGNVYWNNLATLNLAYDLDLWGRQESVAAAELGRAKATEAAAAQMRLELSGAVVRAYVQLGAQHELVDLAREELALLDQNLALARRKQKAGLGAGQEAERIASALHRQRAVVDALEGGLMLARHQLAALAGLGPAAGEKLARPRLTSADGLQLPAALPAELVGRRPDVAMMRHRVEAAGHGIEAARAAFYPNIDLLAFVGFQSLGFSQFLDKSSTMRGVGPAISLPIFDGGRRRSQLSRETAAYDAAVDDYNQSLVHSLQQVADQLSRLASNARELADAGQSLAAAQRRADALQRAHRAGLTPLPAVLEARAQALQAQQAMVRLQAARRSDFAGLVLAAGGELPAESPQP